MSKGSGAAVRSVSGPGEALRRGRASRGRQGSRAAQAETRSRRGEETEKVAVVVVEAALGVAARQKPLEVKVV